MTEWNEFSEDLEEKRRGLGIEDGRVVQLSWVLFGFDPFIFQSSTVAIVDQVVFTFFITI